ncbi:MAG: sugar transferase, partial [Chitinophagaceae bacterium]
MTKPSRKIAIRWYAALDYCTASLAWLLFYFFRSKMLEDAGAYPISTLSLFLILLIVPVGWLILYSLAGTYHALYKKSRLEEFTLTLVCTLFGSIILMLACVLNDPHSGSAYFYIAFIVLTGIHFLLTFSGRWLLLNLVKKQLLQGKVYFNSLLVVNLENASSIIKETDKSLMDGGYRYAGYISPEKNGKNGTQKPMQKLGHVDEMEKIIDDNNIHLVVIGLEKKEQVMVENIINRLSEKDVEIKIRPDILDILSGSVKTSSVMGAALIDVQTDLMPEWQQNIKRVIDIAVSLSALILLFPLILYAALRVKFSSKGSIIYSQERIGYKGKSFHMYKFRSMIAGAEKDGPLLSSMNDPRMTRWGKVMRKWRIDELPQLWNILIGEMSLVGPRPERRYYIDQIIAQTPFYKYLLKVKPGLTSWGMVQFGYAENLEEMIARSKFDLLY